MLLGIVVELRSLRIRSLANPIDVGILVYSVAIQSLRDVGWIEDVRGTFMRIEKGTLL